MSKSVVVVGGYVHDHAWRVEKFPAPGETCRALGFSTAPGGKGFNQAIACIRQGVETVFIGAVGDDNLARSAEQFAVSEKLHAAWLKHPQQPTASASILVNALGENMIAVNLGANNYLSVDFLTSKSHLFENADIVLCQLENNLDAITHAFTMAKKHTALCVLNPAPIHPDIELGLLKLADILTPNETEFAILCQRFTDSNIRAEDVAQQNDQHLHQLCRKLSENTVVITLGRHGCFISHGANCRGDTAPHYRIAAESVNAIDTTGAGDAFNGGLVAALQRFPEKAFFEQARYAGRVAAISTEAIGAAPAMPNKAQVIARFS